MYLVAWDTEGNGLTLLLDFQDCIAGNLQQLEEVVRQYWDLTDGHFELDQYEKGQIWFRENLVIFKIDDSFDFSFKQETRKKLVEVDEVFTNIFLKSEI